MTKPRPASEAQLKFLQELLTEHADLRKRYPEIVAQMDIPERPLTPPANITMGWASTGIEQTKEENQRIRNAHYANNETKARNANRPKVDPQVPDGRYFLDTDKGGRFYVVNTPTQGKWAGFTFVSVQASDDEWPVKNREAKKAVLDAIAADPKAAMLAYGRELGRCGHCNRTLTNDESRELGIGPVCIGKMGW